MTSRARFVYQTQSGNELKTSEEQLSRRLLMPTNKKIKMKIHRSGMSKLKDFTLQATKNVLQTITGKFEGLYATTDAELCTAVELLNLL